MTDTQALAEKVRQGHRDSGPIYDSAAFDAALDGLLALLSKQEAALEMACVELDAAKAKLGGWASSPSREPADAHYLAEEFLARAFEGTQE